jgi:hypothetical protein
MPWWIWIAMGAGLLALELSLIDTGFYLVFLGLAAAAVGLLGMVGLGSALWEQALAFGLLSLLFMVVFRRRVYRRLMVSRASPGLVGERAVVREAIAPGATGRAELRGSGWIVRNVGDAPLTPGASARVEGVQGVTLDVSAD